MDELASEREDVEADDVELLVGSLPEIAYLRRSAPDMLAHISGSTPAGAPFGPEAEAEEDADVGVRAEGFELDDEPAVYALRRILQVSLPPHLNSSTPQQGHTDQDSLPSPPADYFPSLPWSSAPAPQEALSASLRHHHPFPNPASGSLCEIASWVLRLEEWSWRRCSR